MRIAYITTYDPNDRRQWSGSGHAILQSLRLQGFDVVPLGPMRNRLAWVGRQKGRFYYRLLGQSYEFDREALAAWDYALQIKRRLAREPFEIVFSPGAGDQSFAVPATHCVLGRCDLCLADQSLLELSTIVPRVGAERAPDRAVCIAALRVDAICLGNGPHKALSQTMV
jgi:hypothetical protein